MTNLKTRYNELLALTQLFLFKEHSLNDRRISSPASYAFFQPWLLKVPLKKPTPLKNFTPKPQQTIPSPSPPNPSPLKSPSPPTLQ